MRRVLRPDRLVKTASGILERCLFMTILDILATLLVLSALLGALNHFVFGLPNTIGLVVMGLAASLAVLTLDWLAPGLGLGAAARPLLASIDFRGLLLDGFLSALLFAGALHVDLAELVEKRWAVGLLATIGVLISVAVVGSGIWAAAWAFGAGLPLIWALVFGALISPTDPVAVLAMLKTVRVPPSLHAKIAAEALFNDGVGIVVFTIIFAIAMGNGGAASALAAGQLFIVQALGGAVLGLAAGWLANALMVRLDEHTIEVMVTLALVAATYAIALHLHVSGPIAVVVAGVLIGNHGAKSGVIEFWDLVEELLNAVLFLLIGLEVLVIGRGFEGIGLALAAIPIVLAARYLGVAIPVALLGRWTTFSRGAVPILAWAGLRGGISVALALALPEGPYKGVILTATYAAVVFSIVVQGLTMPRLVLRYYPEST